VGELDELQPGDPRRIGPYWLEGRLGSGGMGRVYLGRSPGGRNVAIKVIRADLAENPDFRARFAREASAARKVSGIFTAPVVDADLDGPVPWLATSYIAGPSLGDAVAERGPMPPALVLRLAAGLAEGLAAIHAAGVVHRDLKPSNVLLAEDGPRLIDFGISRSVESISLTRTGTVVGSPGFMSPEQAEGRPVGPPSDIFSLGAVLTFAATGEGPFGEGSTVALLYRVVASEPNIQGVPDELRPLIERCLAKDPRQRPTAAQLLDRLGTAAAVQAYPATVQSVAPPADRDGGPDGRPAPTPPAPERHQLPERHQGGPGAGRGGRRSGRRVWLMAVAAVAVLAAVGTVAFLAGRAKPHPGGASAVNAAASSPVTSAAAGSGGAGSGVDSSASASQLPDATAMAAIGADLARSASVRPAVAAAIAGVQNCSQSPSSAEVTLEQAITTRQNILQGLPALDVSGLPDGSQLVSALTTAMRNSLNADTGYHAWLADLVSSGATCGSNPNQDSNYAAAVTADSAATTSKEAFVAIWNPMAPRYGQQTYTDSGF
jgi:eukaryotic-like serine/threonine-protein kinase